MPEINPDDLLELIKTRATCRKYLDKPIPKEILNKIIEAGVWGPSLLAKGFQPWQFVVITNPKVIKNIAGILYKKSATAGVGCRSILQGASNTIKNAATIIFFYNNSVVSKFMKKIDKKYFSISKITEISAISATVQNMVLAAAYLKIGTCWLESPLFCQNKINKLLNIDKNNDEMIATLSLGYPAEKGRRSPRKPIEKTVEYRK